MRGNNFLKKNFILDVSWGFFSEFSDQRYFETFTHWQVLHWENASLINELVAGEFSCENTMSDRCVFLKALQKTNITVEHPCWILPALKKERIVPVTVEEPCQRQLNNHASGCWTIVPVTVEQLYLWLLNNSAKDCWTIVLVTVE